MGEEEEDSRGMGKRDARRGIDYVLLSTVAHDTETVTY